MPIWNLMAKLGVLATVASLAGGLFIPFLNSGVSQVYVCW
jgi:hypothetical protein